jgi:tetratricopeptide (TPR) repeat protein
MNNSSLAESRQSGFMEWKQQTVKRLETGEYIEYHHQRTPGDQWSDFRKNMIPSIKDLYLVLILACAQVVFLFVEFDRFCFFMVLLFSVFLLMQQFQKNYFTPHFNPIWVPISILAAKTIWDIWPHLLASGVLGLIVMTLIGIEVVKIGQSVVRSFLKSEKNILGLATPLFGMLVSLPETIGQYIQQNTKETDKLFVWGNQPSIYLYSRREAFDTSYLFVYGPNDHVINQERLLEYLRGYPPELIVFYNYKANDGWDMKRLQEAIGIPYNRLISYNITDDQGKIAEDEKGFVYDFPIYRRDDAKFKEILLDRALINQMKGNIEWARKKLESILEIAPEDYEASVRLSLLETKEQDVERARIYLRERLQETCEPMSSSVLMRMLAELDQLEGNRDSAMRNYEKALEHNPNDFRIYCGLGELYFSMDNVEEAFQCFKKSMKLHPHSSTVFVNLGVLLAHEGKREDAIQCFQKALSIMPTHPDALTSMEKLEACPDGRG